MSSYYKQRVFLLCATLLAGLAAAQNICKLRDNAKYDLSQCNEKTDTANAFIYYDRDLSCDMRAGKSDPLPPYLADQPCEQLCKNGQYLALKFKNNYTTPYLKCSQCPANAITA